MTRLQRKCLVCSLGLHGLLAGIVFFSAAFRTRPEESDLQVLSMIPANLLDRAGASGGTPVASVAPPQPVPQQPPPPQPQVVTRAETPVPKVQPREVPPPPTPTPKHVEPPAPEPEPVETPHESEVAVEHKPAKPHHEIHVSYEPASSVTKSKKINEKAQAERAAAAAAAAAAAEQRRLKRVEESLSQLASGVQSSSAEKTVVDVPGIGGGGEVFAGYNQAVYSIYYHAWITPDSVPDRLTVPVARVVVARDGSIISAELITRSGEAVLDKSVERVLRTVKSLPAFPPGARDEQRVFKINFNLDATKASG
ncbi:MAG: TonB C-terminal domain-containing protein [Limisphaerales bacterium]